MDNTARIHKLPTSAALEAPQDQIRQLLQNAQEWGETLRAFGTTLRARGMTLPAGMLDTIKGVDDGLNAVLNTLKDSNIELRQLRALAQTTALFSTDMDTDGVLNQVMDTVIGLTGAERGFLMLDDDATGELVVRIARGIDREQLNKDDFTVSRTIIREVAETGQPIRTDNARNDPRYQSNASIVGYQLRSILAVPLLVRGAVIGVVYCDNRIMTALFKDHELQLLTAFAHQAAVAIQNARLFDTARAQLAAITEMRDLMDNLFASIASGLIALDSDNRITAYNRAAEAIIGVPQIDALGAILDETIPDFLALFGVQIEHARITGESADAEVEVILQTTTGGRERRIWRANVSPLREEAPVPNWNSDQTAVDSERGIPVAPGVAIVLDDLTEQRQREVQVAQVRQYLPPALIDHLRSEDLDALDGVEREITVLFSDVRGFTAFSERLEPEDLMQIINQYLSVASDAIHEFDGVVDKYIGDAVTALFNTQLNPQTDHILRAVRAAMGIRRDVTRLHETLPPDQRLQFGIGIHTGMAVLGSVGSPQRREFAAIGDALDMSKLLQENAGPGEILLSEATYRWVSDLFACEALVPRKAKGRADFTVMYRLLGEVG